MVSVVVHGVGGVLEEEKKASFRHSEKSIYAVWEALLGDWENSKGYYRRTGAGPVGGLCEY